MLFTHAAYLILTIAVTMWISFRARGKTRAVMLAVCLGMVTFYLSFIPTAIACDFRYLFTPIPILSLLAVCVTFGWTTTTAPEEIS